MNDLPESGATFEITAPFTNMAPGLAVMIESIDGADSLQQDSDFGLRFPIFSGWEITANYLNHHDDFALIPKTLVNAGLVFSLSYEPFRYMPESPASRISARNLSASADTSPGPPSRKSACLWPTTVMSSSP